MYLLDGKDGVGTVSVGGRCGTRRTSTIVTSTVDAVADIHIIVLHNILISTTTDAYIGTTDQIDSCS